MIECLNFCDGKWQKPSGEEFHVTNPYNNEVIGKTRASTAKDLDNVVAAAAKAQLTWRECPMKERAQVLFRFREILLRDLYALNHDGLNEPGENKIARQISSECGKTLGEAQAEILKGIEVTEFALSLQNLDIGGRLEVSRGVFCEYRREPLGVVAGITPFNFPAMVPMWMIPIALALGNSFIWKPSDKTPLTSLLIADTLAQAGLPPGVFSVVQGGRSTVEMILDHPQIAAIGFVGSTAVAKAIYQRASQNLKRVLALGGAKNHIFLMPDADFELTTRGVADSFTGCAGQRCMAASVLCAIASSAQEQAKIDKLIAGIVEQAKQISLACTNREYDTGNAKNERDANDERTMGAIISTDSLKRLETAIAKAKENGATIALDGRKPQVPPPFKNGNWLGPTILDHVKPGSHAAVEELFGPILSIIRCRSLDEALEIQNASVYGNAVSVFTQNGGVADYVSRRGKAGMVGVNIGVPVPREPFSFGGIAASKFGQGDITGVHSLNLWSDVKKITTKWAVQKDTTWMG